MNNGNGDFEELKKLLKLKRHEQPPPRYFNDFSDRVLSRIEAGESAGFLDRFSWLQRLKAALAQNPISAGIFAMCGLMVMGLGSSQFFSTPAAADIVNFAKLPDSIASNVKDSGGQPWAETVAVNQDPLPSLVNPGFVGLGTIPSTLFKSGSDFQPVSYIVQ